MACPTLYGDVAGSGAASNAAAAAQSTADAALAAALAALALAGTANTYARTVREILYWFPSTTAFATVGEAGIAVGGTYTLERPTAGSRMSSRNRGRLSTGAGAGSSAFVRNGGVGVVRRGSATGEGGFRLRVRFGNETTVAQQRSFAGLMDFTTGGDFGNTQPSSQTDIIGIGYDSAETTWSIMHNDASGTATKVDLGALFPVDVVSIYDAEFSASPFASAIDYRVLRLNDGSEATGSVSTNLPVNTTNLSPYVWVNNGTTAAVARIAMMSLSLASFD